MEASTFAAYGLALLFAHHIGDYWIQTLHQAMSKAHGTRKVPSPASPTSPPTP